MKNHFIASSDKSGFTLIELSIVLVIIGLIVGGVLVGQDLIEAANRRAVVRQIEQYELAVKTFELKYNALPGDMSNASTILGSSAVNGNGNGALDNSTEGLPFWQHLGLSGLIGGSYSGSLISNDAVAGQNVPTSAAYGGYVAVPFDAGGIGADPRIGIDISSTSIQLSIGKTDNNTAGVGEIIIGGGGIISNQTAYSIDRKVDDGMANNGHWRSTMIDAGGVGADPQDSCTTYTPSDSTTKCTFGYWFMP